MLPQKPGKKGGVSKGGVKRNKTTAQATSTTPQPTVTSQTVPLHTSFPSSTAVTPSPLVTSHVAVSPALTATTVLPGGTPTLQAAHVAKLVKQVCTN